MDGKFKQTDKGEVVWEFADGSIKRESRDINVMLAAGVATMWLLFTPLIVDVIKEWKEREAQERVQSAAPQQVVYRHR